MSKINAGWTLVEESLPLLTYTYSFGPGVANALAFRGAKGLVVVSPPCRVPEEAFTDLAQYGEVAALVASNAFHYLGLPVWKERFPKAELFAPRQSISRIEKKCRITGIKALSEASAVSGPDVELVDMPHYKTGEVLVRARSPKGPIWYLTDVVMNLPKLPGFPIGLIFKWTGSGPGLRPNGVASKFMVKDRKALYAWLCAEIQRQPPVLLVPCHGDLVTLDPPGEKLRSILSG